MSARDMWKMVHLLYRFGKPGIPFPDLAAAGLDCFHDTFYPLVHEGIIVDRGGAYELAPTATAMLSRFMVARGEGHPDILVDYPRAFVIMPFSQPWSQDVYGTMIEPAVRAAGLECVRGDTLARVGDLTSNVWAEILRAGLVIADVTEPNVNVYYELGLTHAVGKDTILLTQQGATLPADFRGAHFCEYSPGELEKGRELLKQQIEEWAKMDYVRAQGVGQLGRIP